MKNKYSSLYIVLILSVLIFCVFYFTMPQSYDTTEAPLSKFSTKRALEKVKEISRQPHYVGSQNHEVIAQYLQTELQNLGLETSFQSGFTMTEKGTLVFAKNIIAKLKGSNSSKSLLLLSHYDSAPHSFSKGASDDASGIATILESVRAFLHTKTKHKNDIVILFTDAEELGLNGAALFISQNKWAKEVGLALNFEARGSSGPSYMLMETNNGNAKMVEEFSKAKVRFPASNSLMYSIYKMLPNDTDLTVFREKGKIQGFNFAFIDSHFNYHTMQDSFYNLNPNTLAHQGSYLVPLLNYFSNADISSLNSNADSVYFTIPFTFISYPNNCILPSLIITFGLFLIFLIVGLGKQVLRLDEIIKGFLPFFGSVFVAGFFTYVGWQLLLNFYPQYNDILHGFTYNGNDYIHAFTSLSLAICFFFYNSKEKRNPEMNQLIAPLFVWFLINTVIYFKLQGAAFLIIPIFSTVIMLGYFCISQKTSSILNSILAIPTVFILVPFIEMFPVGLGLKILFGSSILTVLCFTLLLPLFGTFKKKKSWSLFFVIISIGFFVKAHLESDYGVNRTKPNSLVYFFNADADKAYFTTYDTNLDVWTKNYLGEKPIKATVLNTNKIYSKYGSEFTVMKLTEVKNIPKPSIQFLRDTIKGNQHFYKIVIAPNRKVNRYDIFANPKITVNNLKVNGVKSIDIKSNIINKNSNKIVSYYVVDNVPLELEFSINKNQNLELSLLESSFDLLNNPNFKIKKRLNWMMPKPFVLTDAIVIQQKIKPSARLEIQVDKLPPKIIIKNTKDSLK